MIFLSAKGTSLSLPTEFTQWKKISTDRPIVTFKIKDSENKILDGRYYEQELQKVNIRQ